MERPTCKTCPYWDQDSPDPDEPFGECRKHAPSLFTRSEEIEDEADVVYWPRVFYADWCGEHPSFPAYIAGLNPKANLKAASFVIASNGECPWPPEDFVGKKVRVIVED